MNTRMKPELSIISVNYNGIAHTCEMIESVRENLTVPYELIVVDNGSAVNEAEEIEKRYPEVTVIRSEKNLGFAGGNNLGIDAARGKYLLFLNNDTIVQDDSLKFLCETLGNDSSAGAACPKIKFAFYPYNIQFAGYTPLSRITLRNSLKGFDRADDGSYDDPSVTPYAHGAAMMVRRSVVDEVGKMPEIYFLYYEELDWSEMITRAGYRILYDPRSTVYHKESATTGKGSPLRTYYLARNRMLFGWRNRKGAARYLTILYQMCVVSVRNTFVWTLHGDFRSCSAHWKGVTAFFKIKNKMSR